MADNNWRAFGAYEMAWARLGNRRLHATRSSAGAFGGGEGAAARAET